MDYENTCVPDEKVRVAPRNQWIFYYDGKCGFCIRAVRVLAWIDWFHQVSWVPTQTLSSPPEGLSWGLLDQSAYLDTGRIRYEGFYSFRILTLRLLPLVPLAPLLWLPGVHRLGVPIYRWIARNRRCISRALPDTQPGSTLPRPAFRSGPEGQ